LKNVQRQVRDAGAEDVRLIVGYFHNGDTQFLRGMGVDPAKMPEPDCWLQTITEDLNKPLDEKQFHYLIWEINGQPAGHSNINKSRACGDDLYINLFGALLGFCVLRLGGFLQRKGFETIFTQVLVTRQDTISIFNNSILSILHKIYHISIFSIYLLQQFSHHIQTTS